MVSSSQDLLELEFTFPTDLMSTIEKRIEKSIAELPSEAWMLCSMQKESVKLWKIILLN